MSAVTSTPSNPSAFPHEGGLFAEEIERQKGMTLRDYFAAAALTGFLAAGRHGAENVVHRAFEYADEMLRQREVAP